MLLFPPSHAFAIHFLTSQEETRTDLSAMLQHSKGRTQGRVPKVMRILHLTLLSFLIIKTATLSFPKGRDWRKTTSGSVQFCFILAFDFVLFPPTTSSFLPLS